MYSKIVLNKDEDEQIDGSQDDNTWAEFLS